MSKSGLFRHFGSKRELQLATIDVAAERFALAVAAPAHEAPPGPARLRKLCECYIVYLETAVFEGGCF